MKNSTLEGVYFQNLNWHHKVQTPCCSEDNRCCGGITVNFLLCSILGAIAIIVGLYVVLWGKADDTKSERLTIHSNDSKRIVEPDCIGVKVECETSLSEPLLSENADNADTSTCQ